MDQCRTFIISSFTLCLTILTAPQWAFAGEEPNDSWAKPKVIYGDDDRLDLFEVEDPALIALASSTAAMVRKNVIHYDDVSNTYSLTTQVFGERYRLCQDEPFREQRTAPICSGFLVAPDILITAGHCVQDQDSCDTAQFVFDFALFRNSDDQPHDNIPRRNVYSCEKLIHSEVHVNSADFAVVRLDRRVVDRNPLAVNFDNSLELNTNLLVIGHPVGLPTKVAGGAVVREIEEDYFVANLDTYGGNSGSAVFNAESGKVEGILVRGARDFIEKDGCRTSNRCANNSCGGEDVTKIQHIEPYLQ
jgi:hypothetical protein